MIRLIERYKSVITEEIKKQSRFLWIFCYIVLSWFFMIIGALMGKHEQLDNLSLVLKFSLLWLVFNAIFILGPIITTFTLFLIVGEERYKKYLAKLKNDPKQTE